MTTEQIEIVKENFNQIAPLADLAAAEFSERLFQLVASLRPLFEEDLTEQKKKLLMMLKGDVYGAVLSVDRRANRRKVRNLCSPPAKFFCQQSAGRDRLFAFTG